MLKGAANGTVASAMVFLIGYFISGTIGGAIIVGFLALTIIGNVIFGIMEKKRIFTAWALANSRSKLAILYTVSGIIAIYAIVLGARAGTEGVIAFFNKTILGYSEYSITNTAGIAIFGAAVGAIIGGIGGHLRES